MVDLSRSAHVPGVRGAMSSADPELARIKLRVRSWAAQMDDLQRRHPENVTLGKASFTGRIGTRKENS